MINEVSYMEVRIFRDFWQKYNLSPAKACELFDQYDIWNYIEECYDMLHITSDDNIVDDISDILKNKGVVI